MFNKSADENLIWKIRKYGQLDCLVALKTDCDCECDCMLQICTVPHVLSTHLLTHPPSLALFTLTLLFQNKEPYVLLKDIYTRKICTDLKQERKMTSLAFDSTTTMPDIWLHIAVVLPLPVRALYSQYTAMRTCLGLGSLVSSRWLKLDLELGRSSKSLL